MPEPFQEFSKASYVSLATYRKSGVKVATPVWCAPSGEELYVFSAGAAGKVKRLRNSSRAQLAVCDMAGKVLGDWRDATGVLLHDPVEIERALKALHKKYGWQMWLADVGAKLSGKFHKRAYVCLSLSELT